MFEKPLTLMIHGDGGRVVLFIDILKLSSLRRLSNTVKSRQSAPTSATLRVCPGGGGGGGGGDGWASLT